MVMNKKVIIMLLVVTVVIIVLLNTTFIKFWIMDKATRQKLDTLHPKYKSKFVSFIDDCKAKGYYCVIVSAYRSFAKQQELIDRGEKLAVQPGNSSHNYGMAIDVCFYNGTIEVNADSSKEKWESTGIPALAQKNGLRWGGFFSPYDAVHFDATNGSVDIQKYKKMAFSQFGTDVSKINGNQLKI